MRKLLPLFNCLLAIISSSFLVSCATTEYASESEQPVQNLARFNVDYSSRLPNRIETSGKKTILVDPNVHAWGAYDHEGNLVKAGIATAGGATCPPDDDDPDCRTGFGKFRITSLGDGDCYSKTYPRPYGGGLMPYCMYFNKGQALHGSPDSVVIEQNVSHGCVRMRIPDAEWMRYNFAEIGTNVLVMPYSS